MTDTPIIDLLMVTHARPHYTRLSLPRLLDSCDERTRVWVWHNGTHAETLEVVRANLDHPRLHRFHHSLSNELLREPINWFFENSDGHLLGFVNDDCLVSEGWVERLSRAHQDVAQFGVIACWHFPLEDFIPDLAQKKTRRFEGGHRLMLNPWVQGSGIMLKRQCVDALGILPSKDKGFTRYCIRIAAAGWINGWCVPLVPIDHMDDPRSPNTMLRTDADIERHLPLSAWMRGTRTIETWTAHLRMSARAIQESPIDPRLYLGVRKKIRRLWTRIKRQELLY